MVDKTKQVDLGKLTAYERWELPNIGSSQTAEPKLTEEEEQKLRLPTAEDIEKIRQQAYDAGFEEGREAGFAKGHEEGVASGTEEGIKQGLAQGLEAGQVQINEKLERLDSLLSELVIPLEKQQAIIEEAMLNVSMAVARTVIHRELSLDSSSIKSAVNVILNDLPKVDSGFSLIIHPDDESYIQPILQKYDAAIALKLDPSVTPGGCIFNSSTQLIDYTIEKRFQKTVQSMLAEAVKNTSSDTNIEVPSSVGALSDYPSDILSSEDSLHALDQTDKIDEASEIKTPEDVPQITDDGTQITDKDDE